MLYRVIAVSLALSLTACGGGKVTNPDGPLELDIVAGQDQVAPAGVKQLSDAVVGALYRRRTADGRWRFEFVKTAYAQGSVVVNGSPVVGAVVCSETVAGNFKPFSVCTNTDSNGRATFFYEPGTKAGPQRAEIRGLNAQGQPAVFDTVRATVNPGPVDPNLFVRAACNGDMPRTASDSLVRDVYKNPIAYRVVGDSIVTVTNGRTLTVTLGGPKREGILAITDTLGAKSAELFYRRDVSGVFGFNAYATGKVPANPDVC